MRTRSARSVADLVFASVLAAIFAYAIWAAFGFAEGTKLFPLAIAVPSLVLALVQVVASARERGTDAAAEAPREPDELPARERVRRTGAIAGWILGMFAAVYLLGFIVAIPLAAVAYLRMGARERWAPTVGVAALCWAIVYGLFDRLLHVPLPPGVLLKLIGL